jgi:aspartate kinase
MDEAKVTVRGVPDRPGVAAKVFETLGDSNCNIDMIIQNVSDAGMSDISFTVPQVDISSASTALEIVLQDLGARTWNIDKDIAKVSIIGAGMKSHPGITARMFRTLSDLGINIELISTSPIRVSCVIASEHAQAAARALHSEFELDQD